MDNFILLKTMRRVNVPTRQNFAHKDVRPDTAHVTEPQALKNPRYF